MFGYIYKKDVAIIADVLCLCLGVGSFFDYHISSALYTIGNIKNLKDGDTITYTTVYGTRTYEVVTVETIASSDWSYLQATSDNRITITTCLANQPSTRGCGQAVEVK